MAGHKIAPAVMEAQVLAHGYVLLTEILPACAEAGIGPKSSNVRKSSAKCQELCDCTVQGVIAVGCRAGRE